MKKFILGFLSSALFFSVVSVVAIEYNIYPNPYPVKINNSNVSIEGYNIDGNSYFKLRDIGDAVGFDVDFVDESIVISTKATVGADTKASANVTTPTFVPPDDWMEKYPLPVVTEDSPEYAETIDGIEMRLIDGEYYVYKSTIKEKLKTMGYTNYDFTNTAFFDWNNRKQDIFSNIPTVDEYNQYIPLTYYYSVLLPWIESL